MGPENFDQAFVLRPVLFEAFELVAAGTESTCWGGLQPGDVGIALRLVSIRSSVSAPIMPSRPAKTLPIFFGLAAGRLEAGRRPLH